MSGKKNAVNSAEKQKVMTKYDRKLEQRKAEAERAKKEEKKEGEWLIKERRSSCFSRRFTLPQDIDAEKVTAEFKHGVLSVDIPRKPEPQPKQIAITVR